MRNSVRMNWKVYKAWFLGKNKFIKNIYKVMVNVLLF